MTCSEQGDPRSESSSQKQRQRSGDKREEVSIVNIIIAEGEESSEKQTLVSVLPSAAGHDLKAGAKQKRKINKKVQDYNI